MPQILDEPIRDVIPSPGQPWPERFAWRGRVHHVRECGGAWRRRGRWWLGEGEKHFFRLLTHENLTLDLCREEMTGQWTVAEALD
jgi:hypothetical protein